MGTSSLLLCTALLLLLAAGATSAGGKYRAIPQRALQSVSAWLSHELSVRFTEDEAKCLDDSELLYGGECHQILSEEPCGESEWLVVDKGEAVNGSGLLRAVCRPKPCPPGYGYMADKDSCHNLTYVNEVLCSNLTFTINFFGEGRCQCAFNFGLLSTANDRICYEIYTRGPCDEGSVFVPKDGFFNLGFECRNITCHGQPGEHNNRYVEIQLETGGNKCYELTNKELCPDNGVFYFKKVLSGKFIPICDYATKSRIQGDIDIALSDGCVPGNDGGCVKTLKIPTDKPANFGVF